MARNEEKAQSMLARFREVQAIELGLKRDREKRPYLVSEINSLQDCERWRQEVIREISRSVTKIQDTGLTEYQVRDLNDDINKLLREKGHWERRIKELGGGDYRKLGPRILDKEGKEVPGSRGYKYFGRAKELPGVKELFEQQQYAERPSDKRVLLYQNIDADYYGFRDEDDGKLLRYERQLQQQWEEDESNVEEDDQEDQEPGSRTFEDKYLLRSKEKVPTQEEVVAWLIQRRKQSLLEKFVE